MEALKTLVEQLIAVEESGDCGRQKRMEILREINTKLLTEYEIQIGGLTIEPLRVEAYYFHPGKFEDSTVHGNPQQRTFGRIYRHNKKKIDPEKDNGGVDICLAYDPKNPEKAPYFLSFLIKNSLVNGAPCKQIELNDKVNALQIDAESAKDVLRPVDRKTQTVFHTVRVGLSGKPFGRERLASLIDINRKADQTSPQDTKKSFFHFAPGAGKEQIISEYLLDHPEAITDQKNWDAWMDGRVLPWVKRTEALKKELKEDA